MSEMEQVVVSRKRAFTGGRETPPGTARQRGPQSPNSCARRQTGRDSSRGNHSPLYKCSIRSLHTPFRVRDAREQQTSGCPLLPAGSPAALQLEQLEQNRAGYIKQLFKPRGMGTVRREVEIGSIDFVFVPGLAFDRRGGRVGHGKASFDRLLKNARPDATLAAIAFECQLMNGANGSSRRVDGPGRYRSSRISEWQKKGIVVSGQWSVVSGQWSVVSGQWSVVSGQWSVVSGQFFSLPTTNYQLRTTNYELRVTSYELRADPFTATSAVPRSDFTAAAAGSAGGLGGSPVSRLGSGGALGGIPAGTATAGTGAGQWAVLGGATTVRAGAVGTADRSATARRGEGASGRRALCACWSARPLPTVPAD